MATAKKHMLRSHRSYKQKNQNLANFERITISDPHYQVQDRRKFSDMIVKLLTIAHHRGQRGTEA
ncbi:MAG: hypothetical protein LUD16_12820 [Lachnospiraceae bacterium]|nr:hypothetical protein [Lachnospiraceae bacterium]